MDSPTQASDISASSSQHAKRTKHIIIVVIFLVLVGALAFQYYSSPLHRMSADDRYKAGILMQVSKDSAKSASSDTQKAAILLQVKNSSASTTQKSSTPSTGNRQATEKANILKTIQ